MCVCIHLINYFSCIFAILFHSLAFNVYLHIFYLFWHLFVPPACWKDINVSESVKGWLFYIEIMQLGQFSLSRSRSALQMGMYRYYTCLYPDAHIFTAPSSISLHLEIYFQ